MSIDLTLGMKIYDNAWFLRDRLEPEQVADKLVGMGVTWVIAQSKYLPMANSAVESAVGDEALERYEALDDVQLRRLLAERGIAYFAVLNIGFDPAFSDAHPELLPVDQFGRVASMQDWYVGLPPDREENIRHKSGLLKRAARALSPDGVHLGFIRWPGFWETWLDDVRRADMPEYCFSPRTLAAFAADADLDLTIDDPVAAASAIGSRHRAAWTSWKCGQTVEAIRTLRTAVAGAGGEVPISINTLPFFPGDFDGAVEEVFGQDIARLSEVVDVFEVMAYHQIMRKDAAWPAAVAEDIRGRAKGRQAVCTLQASPLYLDGMHRGRGRASSLDAVEFSHAVDAAERSEVDGICVFTFDDFLLEEGTAEGAAKADRLRRFRR